MEKGWKGHIYRWPVHWRYTSSAGEVILHPNISKQNFPVSEDHAVMLVHGCSCPWLFETTNRINQQIAFFRRSIWLPKLVRFLLTKMHISLLNFPWSMLHIDELGQTPMDSAVRIVRSNSNDSPQFPGENWWTFNLSLLIPPRVCALPRSGTPWNWWWRTLATATAATAGVNDVNDVNALRLRWEKRVINEWYLGRSWWPRCWTFTTFHHSPGLEPDQPFGSTAMDMHKCGVTFAHLLAQTGITNMHKHTLRK